MSLGRVKTGGVLSWTVTVTVKVPLALLPALSVALQDTVVVAENAEPEGGLQENVSRPDTESEALAV
jgi:hypothetical protein